MTEDRLFVTKQLVRADVVDAQGDLFPAQALREMAAQARSRLEKGSDIWVTKGFQRHTASIQGRVVKVIFNEQDKAVDVEVEVFPTQKVELIGATFLDPGQKVH